VGAAISEDLASGRENEHGSAAEILRLVFLRESRTIVVDRDAEPHQLAKTRRLPVAILKHEEQLELRGVQSWRVLVRAQKLGLQQAGLEPQPGGGQSRERRRIGEVLLHKQMHPRFSAGLPCALPIFHSRVHGQRQVGLSRARCAHSHHLGRVGPAADTGLRDDECFGDQREAA
jgi:hypothetical protein